MTVLHHAALALAAAALGGVGLRVAGSVGARGLELVVAAAPVAAAAAVVWALALGLVGLGESALALAATTALTWTSARALLPDPAPRKRLAAWWTEATPGARAGVAAATGAGLALCAWQLRHPYVSLDGLTYHLALPASWLHGGSPGAVVALLDGLPVGNYPLTHEVLVGWAIGLSRSWVVASIITPALAALLAVAVWAALRSLAVPRLVAGLAAAALLLLPLNAYQIGGPLTDLAATTWLAVAAALVALSLRGPRPLLLAPAVVAAGLAVGTKTTPTLLLALVLVFGAWRHRAVLRPLGAPLGAAAAVALLLCAVWPLRNLLEHGSPLWPFVATPFGDPIPPKLAAVDPAFLDHPGDMLDGRLGAYAERLGGGLVLIVAAIVLPLVRRSRAALAVGAGAALAFLAWTIAPYTGITESTELAVGATRYLLPGLLAATAAIALSACGAGPLLRVSVTAVLALAVACSLVRLVALGFPFVPVTALLPAAAGLGAGGALLLGGRRLPASAWAAPVLAAVAGLALAAAAPGYVERHARSFAFPGYAELLSALAAQPGYQEDERPVAMGPGTLALAGGDSLRHPVPLVASTEPCAAVRKRSERGWLVIARTAIPESRRLVACLAGHPPLGRFGGYDLYGPR